jgi:cytosine/adenosine deaminase-related metal-dependent hydrolase
VPPPDIARIAASLPGDTPLHIHLSEQPAENEQAVARYGRTPAQLLADAGALAPRLTAVHATHLTREDILLLGEAGVTVAFCPTTEADLGDGIGPARALAEAGATLSLGSDQNAVVDPFLELRGLEAGERLSTRGRGLFSPAELDAARSSGGYRALGLHDGDLHDGDLHDGDLHNSGLHNSGLRVGAPADLIEVDAGSIRTSGARLAQLPLAATAADVSRVFVGGELVAQGGLLADGRDPAAMLRSALGQLPAEA